MNNFLKGLYLRALFMLYCNREVQINCGNILIPRAYTYYTGPILSSVRLTDEKTEDAPGTKKAVFITKAENIVPKENTIYIFSDEESLNKTIMGNERLFFDSKVLKIVLEKEICNFVSQALKIKPDGIFINIVAMGGYMKSMANLTLSITILCLLYKTCRKIVERLSKMDPIFTDFNIVSSVLQRFKNLGEKSMAQCTICFEDFQAEDEVRILDCKHYYHPGCIDRWLIGHSKRCPCCREIIQINEKL